MLRNVLTRLRQWIAVEDAEDRIEGSGKAISDPQHRRSAVAERTLEELDRADEHDDP